MIDYVTQIIETHDLREFLPSDIILKPAGKERWRSACPLCSSGTGFSVARHSRGYLTFHCFGCHEKGSCIDLYAKLNRISVRQAIAALSDPNAKKVSREEYAERQIERWRKGFGQYVISCSVCPSYLEVASFLEAAIFRDHGTWEVAPDFVGAICLKCLMKSFQKIKD